MIPGPAGALKRFLLGAAPSFCWGRPRRRAAQRAAPPPPGPL